MTKRLLSAGRQVLRSIKNWKDEAPARRFIAFARKRWPQPPRTSKDPVVLVNLFPSKPSIFCYAYALNFLARKHHARLECYRFIGRTGALLKELYQSFGARFTLSMAQAAPHEEVCQARTTEIMAGLRTKWDVINIVFEGVQIGDQIYDSYLRFYNQATVDLADPRFRDVVVQALRIFYATRDYLARNQVAAFITDDFSYINSGIITRLMFLAKVPIYMILFGEPFHILKLDDLPTGRGHAFPPPLGYNRFYAYDKMFALLDEPAQERGRALGREVLEKRLSGEFCKLVRMPGTTYGASDEGRVLDDGPEPRILVMLHDFVDSPHGHRDILFPDFYEWMTFLLERAEKTPFRWYVKPHPCTADPGSHAMNRANAQIIEDFKKQFPKITFLPPKTSNLQVLKDGVTAMFTVYGTAGHEYAYCGIPVVNAGDNPHIAYDFNIHASTLEEYDRCIREADRLHVEIDKRQIEELVYMNYLYLPERLGSPTNPIDEKIFADPNCGERLEKPESYDEFLAGITPERERGVEAYLDQFFNRPEELKTPLAL